MDPTDKESLAASGLHQQHLQAVFEGLRLKYQDQLKSTRDDYEAEVDEARLLGDALSQPAASEPPSFEDLIHLGTQDLRTYHTAYTQIDRRLGAYERAHHILAEPEPPSVLETSLTLGAGVVLESCLNVGFFLNAHLTASPMAALLVCTLISLVNVAVSAAAGHWIGRPLFQQGEHEGPSSPRIRRLFLTYLGGIGFIHLTVGLVRTQEDLSQVSHSIGAYLELLQTPEALFLIALSTVLSAVAFHKGMTGFANPLPKYAALKDARAARRDDLQQAYDDVRDQLTDRADAVIEALEEAADAAAEERAEYHRAMTAAHRAYQHYERQRNESEQQFKVETLELVEGYLAGIEPSSEPFDIDHVLAEVDLSTLCRLPALDADALPARAPGPNPADDIQRIESALSDALARWSQILRSLDEPGVTSPKASKAPLSASAAPKQPSTGHRSP